MVSIRPGRSIPQRLLRGRAFSTLPSLRVLQARRLAVSPAEKVLPRRAATVQHQQGEYWLEQREASRRGERSGKAKPTDIHALRSSQQCYHVEDRPQRFRDYFFWQRPTVCVGSQDAQQ